MRSGSNILTRVWRGGAPAGTTPVEALLARCDRIAITRDDVDNGRLVCPVGIAPVRPAEFVIFRIIQRTIQAQA